MRQPVFVFIGHVSMDHILNPHGERIQPGGAALYAAMGSRILAEDVRLVSAVGTDFKPLDFVLTTFPRSILKTSKSKTTFFRIEYDKSFRAFYREAKLGAGASIRVDDLPLHWLGEQAYLHVAPMEPQKTRRLIQRVRSRASRTWISLNTNIGYLSSSRNRSILRQLANEVDLFIVNDQEVVQLTEAESLAAAVSSVRGKRVAVTLGELGAIIIENGRSQLIPALSGLTVSPKDTTGAGDTWGGVLLAAYALTGDWTRSVVSACIVSALKCLDWGFERIRKLRFTHPDELIDYVLRVRGGPEQLKLSSFLVGEKKRS